MLTSGQATGDAPTGPFLARHDRSKVTDWVCEELRAAIIELRLRPGEPLRENLIAESLGVSKTPVREALARLEVEGLVELVSFKGAVVSSYSRQDLVELYELRELLESWAVRSAATAMPDEDLGRLVALVAAGREHRDRGDATALERTLDEFDGFVFAQVTNRRIAAVVDNLRAHLARIGRLTVEIPGRLGRSVDEHALIVEALGRRDPDAAEAALRHHIDSVLADQLQHIVEEGT